MLKNIENLFLLYNKHYMISVIINQLNYYNNKLISIIIHHNYYRFKTLFIIITSYKLSISYNQSINKIILTLNSQFLIIIKK